MITPATPDVRRRRRRPDQLRIPRSSPRWNLPPLVFGLALLAAAAGGAVAAAVLGWSRPAAIASAVGTSPGDARPSAVSPPLVAEPLAATVIATGETAEAVEAAYVALEAGRSTDARDRFLVLAAGADPATRAGAALRGAAAWCELIAGRTDAAEGLLVASLGRANGGESADARFLLGFSRLLRGEHAEAEKCFARAAALDPTRSDIHLLWGDTLRREGRPRESIPHFRAALRRNRQETNLGFYRLKLWLSQLQAGGEDAVEAATAIAGELRAAGDTPAGSALLGAAAHAITLGRWAEAASFLRDARRGVDPAVFAVALQDPLFVEECARPEFADLLAPPTVPR